MCKQPIDYVRVTEEDDLDNLAAELGIDVDPYEEPCPSVWMKVTLLLMAVTFAGIFVGAIVTVIIAAVMWLT